jgi:hypothetical protein
MDRLSHPKLSFCHTTRTHSFSYSSGRSRSVWGPQAVALGCSLGCDCLVSHFSPARAQNGVHSAAGPCVEKAARKYNAMRLAMPKQAEKLRRAIIVIVASYAARAAR